MKVYEEETQKNNMHKKIGSTYSKQGKCKLRQQWDSCVPIKLAKIKMC